MRILGFSKKWNKLQGPEFTTFRFTRKDKDWQVGEVVQVVYKPRSKQREIMGTAEILFKERRRIICSIPNDVLEITEKEIIADGFKDKNDFLRWFYKTYGGKRIKPMNKLTLRWVHG